MKVQLSRLLYQHEGRRCVTIANQKILIVEDDKNIRETMKNILEQNGYEIDEAETGEEAEQKIQTKFYNLALLDIKLPDMDGTKLLTKLHKDTPKMMKIMVTGYPSLENAIEALNQGADAYVTKPVKPAKLLEIIKEKLEEQSKAEKMTEGKVTEWIKSRAKQLEE
ncbi:MAG: response regulator [Candidatus Bathyarchaeota archaeon]|nr:response regulator [Candidatus Bathyarchaeota archaeon]